MRAACRARRCRAGAQELDAAGEIEARQAEKQAEFDRVSREITLSDSRVAALAAEIAGVKKDHATITAALIQAAKTERKLGEDIEDITGRLEDLKERQEEIRAVAVGPARRAGRGARRAAAHGPEPAAGDAGQAGGCAVVGAQRDPARRRGAGAARARPRCCSPTSQELSRVTASIEAERARLTATVERAGRRKEAARACCSTRRSGCRASRRPRSPASGRRLAELAAKAGSLKELIASHREADRRTCAAAEERPGAPSRSACEREAALAALPVPEANRLAGPQPFSALMKQVALPVTGRIARRFGDDDGNGGVMHGDTVTTQSGAIVTAPSDGNVLYAGPFRSYGQLLILNAGDGYHVVLAGMGRISVAPGQSVLAGEPVGAMGEAGVASTSASGNGNTAPELYVEFRKDGKPVDPAPWWADQYVWKDRK